MFHHEVCGQLSLPNIRKTFLNSKPWTIICILCQRIGYSFDFEEDIGLKCESYLPSSSMSNIYVLIIKSQLSTDVNCNVNIQKMRILDIFMRLSPEYKICNFTGLCGRVHSGNPSIKYQVQTIMEFHLIWHRAKSKKVHL